MSNQNLSIKKKIFKFFLPFIRLICSIFFDKKYLTGKHFDERLSGWHWALRGILWQKIFGFNRHIPWPVSPFITISSPDNIKFDIEDINNFQKYGNYFQNFSGNIIIGKGTLIAPNVAIITANHDLQNVSKHLPGKDVILGNNCWIGINSVILPGVHLGNHTIIGAGSVVTKSFPEGNSLIAGNPAKFIKKID